MIKAKEKIGKLLDLEELKIIKKLASPQKVQDFLDSLPFNFEEDKETYHSPRKILREKKAHCFEGAIFASLCLEFHGIKNYLVDLKVKNLKKDSDHALCVFRVNNFWGAISKTNHSVLRWRDPIYKNIRELVFSYFHEYFLDSGEKTLKSFSKPFDVWKKFGVSWITEEEDLDRMAEGLDNSPHINFVPEANKKFLRKAGKTEIKGAGIVQYKSKIK